MTLYLNHTPHDEPRVRPLREALAVAGLAFAQEQ